MLDLDYVESLSVTLRYHEKHNNLVMMNYSQIETPKMDPVGWACRGHIYDINTQKYVCRPFDRFFNYGEAGTEYLDVDWSKAKVMEKIDGSLIKVWLDPNNIWQAGTKGTFDASAPCGSFDKTFRDLVFDAMISSDSEFMIPTDDWSLRGYHEKQPEFHLMISQWLASQNSTHDLWDCTHLFELTSPYNQVVTPQTETTLWYLGSRDNKTGVYVDLTTPAWAKSPRVYSMANVDDCVKTARSLPYDDEGYVVYVDNIPKFKIKSPAYVAVHHLRGEGMSYKRAIDLCWEYEEDEFLSYFSAYADMLKIVQIARDKLLTLVQTDFDTAITLQPENKVAFALLVKDKPHAAALFNLFKHRDWSALDAIKAQTPNWRQKQTEMFIES